jgi:hypothetical protein
MQGERYEFDVFISYSHKDAKWVTDVLLPRLEKTGLKVCIDNRDFVAGETAIVNMQDSIKNSRRILLVLTPNWVRSRWTKLEAEIASITTPENTKNRIIPLMWKKCEIPEYLARLTWVDFSDTDLPNNDAWMQLLRSLGLPDEKIRQHERKIPEHTNQENEPVRKPQSLLVFAATLLALIALVTLVAVNLDPVAKFAPTPTETVTSTVYPTWTSSPTLTSTAVPPTSTNTPLPTETFTAIPSDTPTATPDPRCIDASMWSPISTDNSMPGLDKNCYDLMPWGISVLNGDFSFILYGKSRAEMYGLSMPLSKDTSVTFNLKVNLLRAGEFWFGISEMADPQQNGIYFVALPNGKFHLRTYRNGVQVSDIELDVLYGNSYHVTLKLEGTRLTPTIFVQEAGTWTYLSQLVTFSQRRFYMGIRPLVNGFADTMLTSLTTNP